MLQFDEEEHVYTWNGKVVPSVTQVLKTVGLSQSYEGVNPERLRIAGERGTKVHKTIELWNAGTLDWSTVDDEVGVIAMGYDSFREDFGWKHCQGELKGYSKKYGFAGTMDELGVIGTDWWIIDYKTGYRVDVSAIFQLAAYRLLLKAWLKEDKEFHFAGLSGAENLSLDLKGKVPIGLLGDWEAKKPKLGILHLKKNGKYQFLSDEALEEKAGITCDEAEKMFIQAANLTHWIRCYRQKPKRDGKFQ